MLTELLARWRQAFARITVVAEAPAAQALDERIQITTGKSEGSEPRGVSTTLADRHRTKMQEWDERWQAGTRPDRESLLTKLRELVAAIELDLERVRHRPPMRVDDRGLPETEHERDERVIGYFAGVHYADAAIREGCTKKWLRELRRRHKLCQTCGLGGGRHDEIACPHYSA